MGEYSSVRSDFLGRVASRGSRAVRLLQSWRVPAIAECVLVHECVRCAERGVFLAQEVVLKFAKGRHCHRRAFMFAVPPQYPLVSSDVVGPAIF